MFCTMCQRETEHSHVTNVAMGVVTYRCYADEGYPEYREYVWPHPVAASDSERPVDASTSEASFV